MNPLQPRPVPAPNPEFVDVRDCEISVPHGATHAKMRFANVVFRRSASTAGFAFDGCTFDGCTFDGCTFEIDGVPATQAQWMATA